MKFWIKQKTIQFLKGIYHEVLSIESKFLSP